MKYLESGSADIFHLRVPDADEGDMRRLIEEIHPYFYPQLRLHSHFNLAEEYGLGGVHLNGRWPVWPEFQTRVSRSCHSLEEIEGICGGATADTEPRRFKSTADTEPRGRDMAIPQYDYVTLSPVYDSISKAGYRQRFSPGNPELKALLTGKTAGLRVIALGGVTPESFSELRDAGFGGAAMLGYFENELI